MIYAEFLKRIINDGIAAAERDYPGDELPNSAKRWGSVTGFNRCRNKMPDELIELLQQARDHVELGRSMIPENDTSGAYWRLRYIEVEIEWVVNCVSALMFNKGAKPIIPPTARAMLKVADVVGVRPSASAN